MHPRAVSKKTFGKKLTLRRETIRQLNDDTLDQVMGFGAVAAMTREHPCTPVGPCIVNPVSSEVCVPMD